MDNKPAVQIKRKRVVSVGQILSPIQIIPAAKAKLIDYTWWPQK